MKPAPSAPAAFQDVLAAMTEVDRLKSREEVLAAEADLPARVADVTARLKAVYAQQGLAVRDETIAQGVAQFFSQRLVFQPPPPTLATRLAVLWIFRRRILGAGLAASAASAAIASTVYFGVVVPAREARTRELTAARQEIETTLKKLHSTENLGAAVFAHAEQELGKTAHNAADPEMPKAVAVAASRLRSDRSEFEKDAKQAEELLNDVSPVEQLTYERVVAARAEARQAAQAIVLANRELDEVAALSRRVAALQIERVSLETAWQRFDHPGPAAGLRSSGEQTYAKGLALVTAFGSATEVRLTTVRLNALADAEVRLRALPADLKAAATAARAISRDPRVDEQILANERAGIAAAVSGDTVAAEKNLLAVREIAVRLTQAYTLRIVNRPREYTRFWRYPRGSNSIKNYYVVVEAVAAEGELETVAIRSEEDGSTKFVSKWAERVDSSTYETIGRDKQDDGVVQDNVFGEKEKGLLSPVYRMGAKALGGDLEAGRINHWEYRG